VIGAPQQSCGAFEAAGQQVGVRRLSEGAAELAAEMGARETGGASQITHLQWLEVPGVRQVLGAQQMASGRREGHAERLSAGTRRRSSET
jgi:hypothetical protein